MFLYATKPDAKPFLFGVGSTKGAWNKVHLKAGITDLRLQDFRHTYATRLVSKHLLLFEAGRVLGHTQPETIYLLVEIFDQNNIPITRAAGNSQPVALRA